ncbi:MAG TPA: PKD domain-containing protein, partial [Candidatus Limnocylindrales bacterium]|nr:PKD domain-containing protein [Candidatus Limnocylindrales bacterium]
MVGLLLASLAAWPAAVVASQPLGQFLWWTDEGDGYRQFGPNATVTIHTGAMAFVNSCALGVNDFLFPWTDIYVVRTGTVGDGTGLLSQALASPKTVQGVGGGLFTDEPIAFTFPTNQNLPEGEYAIVYDECQDGYFNAGTDALFDPAFRVEIGPTTVPLLPLDLSDMKAEAFTQAQVYAGMDVFMNVLAQANVLSPSRWQTSLGIVTSLTGLFLDDPVAVLSTHLRNMVRHYLALHADPPDPAFAQPTTVLNPAPGVEPRGGSPALAAAAALATEAGAEAALIEAFVHSLERYQGAAAVSDGTWALAHARAMAVTALDVDAQLERTAAALDDLANEADAQAADLDGAAAALIDLRDRLATDALTDDERLLFRSLGLADDLDVILDDLVAMNLDAFDAASSADDLRQAATDSRAARATWQSFSAAMSDIVATLVADPTVEDLVPVALPGGPYAAVAGTPVGLAGGGTSGGTPIVAYAWDLDLDGDFDDAAGATPTVTFDAARAGVIGLRVSDGDGRHGVAYAPIVVTWPGAPPQIDARTPLSDPVEVLVGASQAFSVTVSDPDGPTPTVEWLLDGATAATGLTYQLDTTTADLGTHVVEAVADDGSRQRVTSWAVGVRAPDGDGDGWPANLDCDDADGAVNPGATEIALNGVDDDCDPGTSDDGLGPTAAFVSSAPAGGRNVALFDVGPAGSTPSAVSAIVMAESPAHASNWAMSAALDAEPEGPSWAAGPAALRYGVVRLWGNATWLIDRIAITPRIDYQPQRVRDFAVDVSTTGFASEADWTQVLSATAGDSGALQSFVLPGGPVAAKYVRVRLLSNRGDPTYISVSEFKVFSPQQSAGSTFDFEDRSSDPEDDIVSRSWDFGDGSASSLTNPSHTYSAPGAYTVTLTVTDSRGHTNSTSLAHRVLTPPTASFGQPATIFERDNAFVTPSASDPDGERIVRIRWSWGDNSPDTSSPHMSFNGHQYLQDGSYTIQLAVTDAQEQVTLVQRTATVLNRPPNATLTNRSVIGGLPFTFNANPSDFADPITCEWDWGDGSSLTTGCDPKVHVYPSPAPGAPDATYTQTFRATDDHDTTTRTATITVTASLPDRILPDGRSFLFELPALLSQVTGATTCAWDFGDGSATVTGCGSQNHAYPAMTPGAPDAVYALRLQVTRGTDVAVVGGDITVKASAAPAIYHTDFTGGASADWSGITSTEGVQGFSSFGFEGVFLRNATATSPTTLTLVNLPPHDAVSLGFLLAMIDSWDGNNCGGGAGGPGPDRFTIRVDGTQVFSEVFQNSGCGPQSYVPPPGVELVRHRQIGFISGGFFDDSAYNMALEPRLQAIPHTGATLIIEFAPATVGALDESFALDDFEVMLHGVTSTAPVAEAGGPYTVTEGESVLVDASGSSDPDGDSLTYAWDLDDDGAFDDATGATATFAALEGPAAHTVHVRVTDSTNLAATDSATVSVLNAPPSGTFDATSTIFEGDSATLAWTAATDPSTTDAAALHYSFSCDATLAQPTGSWALAGTSSTTSCTYDDDAVVNVIGRVLDPQNASTTTGAIVTITNVAP